MSTYLDKVAEYLAEAEKYPATNPQYRKCIELADRYERLARMEQGLAPTDTTEGIPR